LVLYGRYASRPKRSRAFQNRRVLVGGPGQFIQPAARQNTQAIKMRLEPSKIIRLQIQLEKVAQAAIYSVEILPGAIRRDVMGATIAFLRCSLVERFLRVGRVHL
jgi:hypothetical protein